MHVLANRGWEKSQSSYLFTIKNLENMKENIIKKIEKTLVRINVNENAEDAYNELIYSRPGLFNMLSHIYRLNEEEKHFAWSAGL